VAPVTDQRSADKNSEPEEKAPEKSSEAERGTEPDAPAEPSTASPDKKSHKDSDSYAEDVRYVAQYVVNNHNDFHDAVTMGAMGVSVGHSGELPDNRRRRVTGRLADDEVAAVVSRFHAPDDVADLERTLRDKHVVVLEGGPGTGRRAASITLLRRVTTGRLVVLSPLTTVKELAERPFKAGRGYVIVDRASEKHSADTAVAWSNVREQVRESSAYLVVTTTAATTASVRQAVPHRRWCRPATGAVLRSQLLGLGYAEQAVDGLVAQLVEGLPEECPLARLVELAELVADGVAPADAVARVATNLAQDVAAWFAEDRTLHEIVEVLALCFVDRPDVRTFEKLVERLRDAVAGRLSKSRAKQLRQSVDPLADRGRWIDGHDLLGMREISRGPRSSSVVAFREPSCRGAVLRHLWRTQSSALWDAVAEWIDGLVVGGGEVGVARGLAELARIDYDEVERVYLERWSWGELALRGQTAAVLTYGCCCSPDNGLATVVLETVVRWAGEQDIDRRWTALVTLAGDLGICFPEIATNRIWQLISQSDDLSSSGAVALASLFATLVDASPDDAAIVLTLLERKVEKYGGGRVHQQMRAYELSRIRNLVMSATLAVLSAPGRTTGGSAVFEYLHRLPDKRPGVAALISELIRFRPYRRAALTALHRGLHSLRHISDEPRAEAGDFGASLSDAMSVEERREFTKDFTSIDRQLRAGTEDSPADVLIACLDALTATSHPED
jgi:hypothetical protein